MATIIGTTTYVVQASTETEYAAVKRWADAVLASPWSASWDDATLTITISVEIGEATRTDWSA